MKEAQTENATRIAYTTENSKTVERDVETTATKDGPVGTPGAPEVSIDATAILSDTDTMIEKLEEALINGDIIEIWETDLTKPGATANKFKSTYYQGYLSSLEKSAPADGFVECSLEFAINGTGAKGEATVTQDQLNEAMYVFKDTQKEGE